MEPLTKQMMGQPVSTVLCSSPSIYLEHGRHRFLLIKYCNTSNENTVVYLKIISSWIWQTCGPNTLSVHSVPAAWTSRTQQDLCPWSRGHVGSSLHQGAFWGPSHNPLSYILTVASLSNSRVSASGFWEKSFLDAESITKSQSPFWHSSSCHSVGGFG